jgi:ADP-heptose:LPS heptosyltransferase
LWHGECLYEKRDESFDIVLNDGYNRSGSANWQIKSYPHYQELAKALMDAGYSVASVGIKPEYIQGTINSTGLSLLGSIGVVKNAKLFISNDTGLYHCANALGVDNIVLFTATSIEKNYDERFHKHSTIVGRADLSCRPCQAGRRWNKDCKTWDCREISVEKIMEKVLNV